MILESEVAEACVEHWGFDSQLAMVVEECAELILAIQHGQRRSKKAGWEEVVAEMVDVEIMLEQLRHMARSAMGPEYDDHVDAVRREKHERLFTRIKWEIEDAHNQGGAEATVGVSDE